MILEHYDFTVILTIFLKINNDFAEFLSRFSCSPMHDHKASKCISSKVSK